MFTDNGKNYILYNSRQQIATKTENYTRKRGIHSEANSKFYGHTVKLLVEHWHTSSVHPLKSNNIQIK